MYKCLCSTHVLTEKGRAPSSRQAHFSNPPKFGEKMLQLGRGVSSKMRFLSTSVTFLLLAVVLKWYDT